MTDELRKVNILDRLDSLKMMVRRYDLIRDDSEKRLWKSVINTRVRMLLADGVAPATIAAIVPWYANIPEAD